MDERRDRAYYSGTHHSRARPSPYYNSTGHNNAANNPISGSRESTGFFSPGPRPTGNNSTGNSSSSFGFKGRGSPAPPTTRSTPFAAIAKKPTDFFAPGPSINFVSYPTSQQQPTTNLSVSPYARRQNLRKLDITEPTDFPALSNNPTNGPRASAPKPHPSSIFSPKPIGAARRRPTVDAQIGSPVTSLSPISSITSPRNVRKPVAASTKKKPKTSQERDQLVKDFFGSSVHTAAAAAVHSDSAGVDKNNNKSKNKAKLVLSEQEFNSRSNTPTKGLLPLPENIIEKATRVKSEKGSTTQKSQTFKSEKDSRKDKKKKSAEKSKVKSADQAKDALVKPDLCQPLTPEHFTTSKTPPSDKTHSKPPQNGHLTPPENTEKSPAVLKSAYGDENAFLKINDENDKVNLGRIQVENEENAAKNIEAVVFSEIVWNKAVESRLLREMGWTGSDEDLEDDVDTAITDSEIQEFLSSKLTVSQNRRTEQKLFRAGSECD